MKDNEAMLEKMIKDLYPEVRVLDCTFQPCPFCGSDHIGFIDGTASTSVICGGCGACGPEWNDRQQAVSMWNNRYETEDQTP